MSLASELEASKALSWLSAEIEARAKTFEGRSPPSLDGLRPVTFGDTICRVPEIARWYFGWGLDLRRQERNKVAHTIGFKNIEAKMFMVLGWYETFRTIPESALTHYFEVRNFVSLDLCQGGLVVPVTAMQLSNISDTFTVMPR